MNLSSTTPLTRKDFQTDQDVRWCPGCGDYSILAAVQKVFPELGIPRERFAIVSGIGCSSRFPYYMNTFGFHTIHGRPLAVATGLKAARPELSVWVVAGDGDALSIGGNHFLHALRRNVDLKMLLFNNRIYGLTKGQYSPTSPEGTESKSSPMGSVDHPIEPAAFAIGSGATFFARTLDRDPKHLAATIARAAAHTGLAVVEIYQNCNIFNDGAFDELTQRSTHDERVLELHDGAPLVFGIGGAHCIVQEGFDLVVAQTADVDPARIVVHREAGSRSYAHALSQLPLHGGPVPVGVFRAVLEPTYDAAVNAQVVEAQAQGGGDLGRLLLGRDAWTVSP